MSVSERRLSEGAAPRGPVSEGSPAGCSGAGCSSAGGPGAGGSGAGGSGAGGSGAGGPAPVGAVTEGPISKQLLARRAAAVPRGVVTSCPQFIARARGAEIWDVDGQRLIDFAGGIAVLNVGHCHPRVVAAVRTQSELLMHAAFQVQAYESYVRLAERLNQLAPVGGPAKTILFSTGAEAVENAVKIARAHTRRRGILAFSGAFHGRTLLTMGLTGKVAPYKAGFGPFPADLYHVPYPMEYRGIRTEDSLAAIDRLFATSIPADEVAAVIIEPVLGEGGYYAAPAAFLTALRALCDRHGIVFIADEIQSGFARTGQWFGIQHAGVQPDLMTVAKSLAGGLPLSGVVGKAAIMDAPGPGGLGGTYAGNPVACAAAHAALDVIEDERLCERAQAIGVRFHEWGRQASACHPAIGEVRGPGAMIGIELVQDRATRAPDAALTARVRERARAHGLLILGAGVHSNVLRIMVPLVIPDGLLEEGIAILDRALGEAAAGA